MVYLQGKVCCGEKMCKQGIWRGFSSKVHQETSAREVLSRGDTTGSGDAGNGPRSPEAGQSEGGV